ncbi:MAG: 30S ribosomal protein S16 [Deltaproteobacteria bacterium]|nr:30S ribosomal protein S16 [Deltaproteobacteria bacterium]
MVRIRLTRMGAKKKPFYRVIAADSRSPRDGSFIEQLGYYDPMQDPYKIELKMERVNYWIGQGAQPSDTVKRLIKKFESNTAASV